MAVFLCSLALPSVLPRALLCSPSPSHSCDRAAPSQTFNLTTTWTRFVAIVEVDPIARAGHQLQLALVVGGSVATYYFDQAPPRRCRTYSSRLLMAPAQIALL